jgi:midasin
VVANALTLLEAGELSVCSFGETMELLHPFHEQFTSQSGARLLTKFTFEQKKTKIAQVSASLYLAEANLGAGAHSVHPPIKSLSFYDTLQSSGMRMVEEKNT